MDAAYSFSWICHLGLRSPVADLAAPCSPASGPGHAKSLEAIESSRMGLWAYASSVSIACPQDAAPIRATYFMASQTDSPDSPYMYDLHLYLIL